MKPRIDTPARVRIPRGPISPEQWLWNHNRAIEEMGGRDFLMERQRQRNARLLAAVKRQDAA